MRFVDRSTPIGTGLKYTGLINTWKDLNVYGTPMRVVQSEFSPQSRSPLRDVNNQAG